MNLPRSRRFANRHNPSPSNHNTLIRSPRHPPNTNTCPENGFSWSAICTIPLRPVNPRRRSVTPAAIQIRVPAGNPNIRPNTRSRRAAPPRLRSLLNEESRGELDLHRPPADVEDAQPTRPDLLREMSDKVTGRSLLDWLLPSRPSRYFLRQ